MGKPLTIQDHDEEQINSLKEKMGAASKIEVVRAGLKLLGQAVDREKRVQRWIKSVALISNESQKINKEFQKHSLLNRK